MTITETLHARRTAATPLETPSVDDIEPPACGEWLRDEVGVFLIVRQQAASHGITPVCHNTGDGWVFGWDLGDEDPTESLEPLLSVDWFPVGPGLKVSSSELARLGFVEV